MKIELNADGQVVARNELGRPVYFAFTLEEYQKDGGLPLPSLPEGMVRFEYEVEAGLMTYFDRFGNAFPVEGAVKNAHCESIAAEVESLAARKDTRLVAEAATKVKLEPAVSLSTTLGTTVAE